jgi:hypothetical protein
MRAGAAREPLGEIARSSDSRLTFAENGVIRVSPARGGFIYGACEIAAFIAAQRNDYRVIQQRLHARSIFPRHVYILFYRFVV